MKKAILHQAGCLNHTTGASVSIVASEVWLLALVGAWLRLKLALQMTTDSNKKQVFLVTRLCH